MGVFTYESDFNKFLKLFYREIFFEKSKLEFIHSSWQKAKLGEIDSNEYWKTLGQVLGGNPVQIKKQVIKWYGFRKELIPFLRLMKKNYVLILFTNQIEDWFEYYNKKHHLDKIFDKVITSYDIHFSKPSNQSFLQLINKNKLNPVECVLIDDTEKVIVAASKYKFRVIKFCSINRLKKDLKTILTDN